MKEILMKCIDNGLRDVEFIDIRVQEIQNFMVKVVNGKSREIIDANEKGLGIRAFKGGSWGFSCSNQIDEKSIYNTMKNAIKLATVNEKRVKNKFKIKEFKSYQKSSNIPVKINIKDIDTNEKIKYVLNLDNQGKEFDKRIINTNVFYADGIINEIVCNSFGTNVESTISAVRTVCTNYSLENGIRQRGFSDIGGTGGYEIFQTEKAQNLGNEASDQAIRLLKAKPAKAGTFPAILGPKLSSLFIHEAFGHCCEADAVLAGESILENKIGSVVGSEKVTIIDDPTITGNFGSYLFDSEGTPAQKKILVEKGVLKNFLHSNETTSRMDLESPTGNARAESYQNIPLVRMSNIYINKGDYSFEEMLEEIKNGIFANGWIYGYVDIAQGVHQFKAAEAYLIEKGELSTLLRDCAISGLTLEVLNNIGAIGKELEFSAGTCGKSGQYVRVGDGGPYLLTKNIIFGGLE